MNKQIMKEFVESYFKNNGVELHIDKNKVYTVELKDVLANRLGKVLKFSFNKEIAEDYGVDYIYPNSRIFRFIVRDSINKGLVSKGELTSEKIFDVKKKLDNNIFIKKKENNNKIGVSFLYKISSSNRITDNEPEKLSYVVMNLDDLMILPKLRSEFHNYKVKETAFKCDTSNFNKAYSMSNEEILKEAKSKYETYEEANLAHYEGRKKEFQERHENLIKDLKLKEKKIENDISEVQYKISRARKYNSQQNYLQQKKKKEIQLKELSEKHTKQLENNLAKTGFLIEEEKEKYLFDIKIYLCSVLFFKYPIETLTVVSNVTNDEIKINFNSITNDIEPFLCSLCKTTSREIFLSHDGHFCCENCSNYNDQLKTRLCKKDDVATCVLSGELVLRKKENLCESCENYYKEKFITKDTYDKNCCKLCLLKCHLTGKKISKKDSIYCEYSDVHVKKELAEKCQMSNTFFMKQDIVETTGDGIRVGSPYVKTCKKTGLTFAEKNMDGDISELYNSLKEIKTLGIKEKKIQEQVSKESCLIADNDKILLCKTKKFLFDRLIIYDKIKKVFIKK